VKLQAVFRTRPGWGDMGDLQVGYEELGFKELGWTDIADARATAEEMGLQLEVVVEKDYVVKNPRREDEDGDQ